LKLVDPDVPPSGNEVRALLLARRAVETAEPKFVGIYRNTLARALYRLGRFDEALEEQRRALSEVATGYKEAYEGHLRRLESDISKWRDESGALRRGEIEERLKVLEREIATLEQIPDVRRWLDER
jgi:tetratricopeptide (TPR) repeat protein